MKKPGGLESGVGLEGNSLVLWEQSDHNCRVYKIKTAVVIYTSLDEMYSDSILKEFERKTGIIVKPVYDTESAKTTGLVTRLIAERSRPRADIFWNSEVAQTIILKNKHIIAPYRSQASAAIPSRFKDDAGYWTGFAARGRVIIYNTKLVSEPPTSVIDFVDEKWLGKAAIAMPLFGTMATHAAALFALWGDQRAKDYFARLKKNKVAVLSGNAQVRDMVARGEYAIGLTDTDDANGAVEDSMPAKWLFPDQRPGGIGTLIMPSTVALIAGGPNPTGGRLLIDYLLSPGVEFKLANQRSIQIPLNPAVQAPENVPKLDKIKCMDVGFEAIAEKAPVAAEYLKKEFLS